MDPQTLSRLFEPFFTTKAVGKGTGLGLATVYGIVKQNEGFISVRSEVGQGTAFHLYLPRYQSKAQARQLTEAPGSVIRGTQTILLVEDEPMILDIAMVILVRAGYTVLPAASPSEAQRLAREHTGIIDLLVTDVIMPEMNGRDLARNLLALFPEMKCLFMSGYTADLIAHHGVLGDGVCFLQKPFTKVTLTTKVEEALAGEKQ
jgi:CheY-like chemotaxis protein